MCSAVAADMVQAGLWRGSFEKRLSGAEAALGSSVCSSHKEKVDSGPLNETVSSYSVFSLFVVVTYF